MTNNIRFTKMHGAGNDYIYVNTLKYPIANPEELAISWSAPHTGIGSDGLVLIGASTQGDFSMRIFNADGSEALMCGNAARCIGKYLYEYGLTRQTEIALETLSGIKVLKLHLDGDTVDTVTVDMGAPADMEEITLEVDGRQVKGTYVSMGNPHFVIFVDDINKVELPVIGPKIEHHPRFAPGRVNTEFAQLKADGSIRMRVWERGSGITQACGTGACATAVAAALSGRAGRTSNIVMDGGTLTIAWNDADCHVLMTGGATKVFDGEITVTKSPI
ncbi:MAG: diaminopimelate epimerase [Prevotellaceae bacterium]|jgi:diaminopimelate epimerase|nr:diaminopimelate epimerase [Prevotellaceae bacterium]